MSAARNILNKTLVRPYYRQNTSFFLFLFILSACFSSLNSHDPLDYHYRLIMGMLEIRVVFLGVFLGWLFYMRECSRFVIHLQQSPDHSFLNMLYLAGKGRPYKLLLQVQGWLSFPISCYALAVIGVALYKRWYGEAALVAVYILSLCMISAAWCMVHLSHPGKTFPARLPFTRRSLTGKRAWWRFFTGYLLHERKSLFLGIKIFSCGALYLLTKDLTPDDYDLRMPVLFYSFGIFAHGVLIYRFRELEDGRMIFYRGLPVSLPARFAQYILLYLLLFIPEIITLIRLAPYPLHPTDAVLFACYGYSLLLLLNSILFAGALKMGGYVRLIFVVFLLQYGFVLAGALPWLTGSFIIAAATIFFWRYYRYESRY